MVDMPLNQAKPNQIIVSHSVHGGRGCKYTPICLYMHSPIKFSSVLDDAYLFGHVIPQSAISWLHVFLRSPHVTECEKLPFDHSSHNHLWSC